MRSETSPSAQRSLEEATSELAALNNSLVTVRSASRRSSNRAQEATEEANKLLQEQNKSGVTTRSKMLARAQALLRVEKANSAAQADRLSIAHKEVRRIELEVRIDELRLSVESARGRP